MHSINPINLFCTLNFIHYLFPRIALRLEFNVSSVFDELRDTDVLQDVDSGSDIAGTLLSVFSMF